MKIIHAIVCVVLYAVYLAFWLLLAYGVFAISTIGGLTMFDDYFGAWFLWAALFLSIGVFAAPIYLRKKIHKEYAIALTSLAMSILLVVIGYFAFAFTAAQFEEFTPEKWARYPRQRVGMASSMEESIKGLNEDQVIELLGEPFRRRDYDIGTVLEYTFVYGYIEIWFENHQVDHVHIVDSGKGTVPSQ